METGETMDDWDSFLIFRFQYNGVSEKFPNGYGCINVVMVMKADLLHQPCIIMCHCRHSRRLVYGQNSKGMVQKFKLALYGKSKKKRNPVGKHIEDSNISLFETL